MRAGEGAILPQAGDNAGYARLLVRGDAAFFPQEQLLNRRDYGEYFQHEQDEWLHVVDGEVEVDATVAGVDVAVAAGAGGECFCGVDRFHARCNHASPPAIP